METVPDPIEEQLNQFEHDIRQLKIEYEQYFGGGRKRPPAEIEWRIDLVLKRYSDRGAAMNYAQRFRFGNLAQTYARYREVFHKRLKKQEEGTVERHYGAAARAVEAERARGRRAEARALAAVICAESRARTEESGAAVYGLQRRRASAAGKPPTSFRASNSRRSSSRKPRNFGSKKEAARWNSSSAWKAAKPG